MSHWDLLATVRKATSRRSDFCRYYQHLLGEQSEAECARLPHSLSLPHLYSHTCNAAKILAEGCMEVKERAAGAMRWVASRLGFARAVTMWEGCAQADLGDARRRGIAIGLCRLAMKYRRRGEA